MLMLLEAVSSQPERFLPTVEIPEGTGAGEEIVNIRDEYDSSHYIFVEVRDNQQNLYKSYFLFTQNAGTIVTRQNISRDVIAGRLGKDRRHLPVMFNVAFLIVINVDVLIETVIVTVRILDQDNNVPVFTGYQNRPFSVMLSEGIEVGETTGIPTADDNDEGNNTVKNYTLLNSINNLFSLRITRDSNDFVNDLRLVVNSALNREMIDHYTLHIVATEGNSRPDNATLIVDITVLDVCDEPPEFPVTRYSSFIEENSPAHSVIPGNFTAVDIDILDNITYVISEVCSHQFEGVAPCVRVLNSQSPFQLDRETGDLTITRQLDREQFAEYEVTILATDNCDSQGTATVVVTVLNVNDNAPNVTSTSSPDVHEGVAAGFQIYFLFVEDPDYGMRTGESDRRFTYELYDNSNGVLTETNLFHLEIDPSVTLVLSQPLDWETTSHYELVLNVTDWGTPNRSTVYPLPINVVDTNDNSPQFRPIDSMYVVRENTTRTDPIVTLVADDRDSVADGNGRVTYSIPSAEHRQLFSVDQMGRLILTGTLDREAIGSISVLVMATDNPNENNGMNRSDSIVVNLTVEDINDNTPLISAPSHTLVRSESFPTNTVIFTVVATDGDYSDQFSNVTFSMRPDNLPFLINPSTGSVTLVTPLDYDRGETSYNFTVVASDSQLMSTRQVVLRVEDTNDERCTFDRNGPYVASINESSPENFHVVTVSASDLDTPMEQLRFAIVSGNLGRDFNIDERTGEITTAVSLDHDVVSNYTLRVSCSDGSGDFTTASVVIQVSDINDNTPQFVDMLYNFMVSENLPEGRTVGRVRAVDGDSMSNAIISYRIIGVLPVSAMSWFRVNERSGEITTRRILDREADELVGIPNSIITINIGAYDNPTVGNALFNATLVHVEIIDANDQAPVFSTPNITITLPENYQVGLDFPVRIQATDRDIYPNNQIRYEISGESLLHTDDLFIIQEDTGVLRLESTLDFEMDNGHVHVFDVQAIDVTMQNHQATQTVIIVVTNVGENNVTFVDFTTMVSLPENSIPGLNVSQFTVTDISQTPLLVNLPRLTYSIRNLDGTLPDDFAIRSDVVNSMLIVYVNGTIDRESSPVGNMETVTRVLNITASDPDMSENSHGSTSAILRVNILDINDNHPVFSSPEYTFQINENNEVGVVIGEVMATDADFGVNGTSGLTYQISGTVPFEIDGSGNIRATQRLDREASSGYDFTIIASDGASTPMTATAAVRVTVLDLNDNPPMFNPPQNITFHVREDARVNTVVGQLEVVDRDDGLFGQVNISIGEITSRPYFRLEPDGSIILTQVLDRETTNNHFFTAVATDGSDLSTTAEVSIVVDDVNDNAPIFRTVSTIRIHEDQPNGVPFTTVTADDEDIDHNGMVRYAIGTYALRDTFCIDPTGGEISLCAQDRACTYNSTVADYEREIEYDVNVVAYDLGTPRFIVSKDIRIVIRPVNEHPPSFDRDLLFVYVDESSKLDVEVAAIRAMDRDRGETLTYEVTENGLTSSLFRYDRSCHAIVTSGILNFDQQHRHDIFLRAVDSTDSENIMNGTIQVVVVVNNINNNAPVFESESFREANRPLFISENVPTDTVIWTVRANDADNSSFAAVSYHLLGGAGGVPFGIDSLTGVITTNAPLDFETSAAYTLRVVARDNDGNESASISLPITIKNENDHLPVFSSSRYTFSFPENRPANSSVGRVQAPDRDNGSYGEVRYCFSNGNNPNFEIDPVSGEITSLAEFDSDSGAMRYDFMVYATDIGRCTSSMRASTRVVVTVTDENDNPPVFGEPEYLVRISPTQIPSVTLDTLSVADIDDGPNAQYQYEIDSQPGNLQISISPTGELSLNEPIPTTYNPAYVYTVRAIDVGDSRLQSSVRLEIIIETENDHHPVFSPIEPQSVIETTQAGTPIFVVRDVVRDDDTGSNGELTFEFVDSYPEFGIDEMSGVITLREMLDYEGTREYNISVRAMDGRAGIHRTAMATIMIVVEPINEHAPEFMGLPSQLTLSYIPFLGLKLLTIRAMDGDQGSDGDVRYNLFDTSRLFSVETETGILRNQGHLTTDDTFMLTIGAYDLGNPFRSSNTTIQINIQNPEVSRTPTFVGENPRTFLHAETNSTELFLNSPLVTTPSASSFHLVKQTVLGRPETIQLFDIRSQGQLINLVPLDHEQVSEYSIVIESRIEVTSGPVVRRMSDFLTVTLRVTDVNDNVPFFSLDDQSFNETTPVNTPLFKAIAVDGDSGPEGTVMYNIVGGNNDGTFRINHTSGQVFLDQPLDRETVSSYDLVIRAHDTTIQPKSFERTVHVTVTDYNDFETTYGGRNFTVGVNEFPYTHAGQTIIKLAATDMDEGPPLIYQMDLVEAKYLLQPPREDMASLMSRFVMDPDTGEVTVGAQSLDREAVDYYLYRVTARDQVHTAVTYLTINILDVNDNSPVATTVPGTIIQVQEGQPAGLRIPVRINVADADIGLNSHVMYSLGEGWPDEGYFRIDPLTGVIRTTRTIVALRDIFSFEGRVIVQDQGENPRRTFISIFISIIDINNHPPVFDDGGSITLSLNEGAEVRDMPIHDFNATDEDFNLNASPFMFSIPSYYNDARRNFRVGPADGKLYLQEPQPHVKTYNFVIHASNPSFSPRCVEYSQASSITVTVNVRPINSGPPVFTQRVYSTEVEEETMLTRDLIRVEAVDPDGDTVTYSIVNSEQYPFSLHPQTGALTLATTLDRENTSSYTLTVLATDDGFPANSSSVAVVVTVLDINDHRPLFERGAYFESIQENFPTDALVLRISATDVDPISVNMIEYELAESDSDVPFRIERSTGMLFVTRQLDYDTLPSDRFIFRAIASDNGSPPLTSSVDVTVVVQDINEFPPMFVSRPPQPIDVSEGPIITLVANDSDRSAELFFSFGQPDPSKYFELNNRTGEVSLKPTGSDEMCPDDLPKRLIEDPQFLIINTTAMVTDGESTASIPLSFRIHEGSFCTITSSSPLPVEIITASVTGFLVIILVLVCIVVFACICRARRHSKIRINDRSPSVELRKKFGSGRSSAVSTPANIYKQTSFGPGALPHEHTTMNISHSVGGSGASSIRQSYMCGDEMDVEQKEVYPSPGVISRKSQLSKPYRSTSDLGSSTVATDMLSGDSQEMAPYPKAQIEKIYAKNADLLNHSDSNESIHMFGSEGGGESDGGDDMLFRKFDDLDDDDDSTTMPDEDDRSYQRATSRDDLSVPPIMDNPYEFEHPASMWAPRVNTMDEMIDQMAINTNYESAEEHMRRGGGGGPPPPHYMSEFSKSQEGVSMYGGASTQESTRPLLRHAHLPHPQSRMPPQHMMQPPPDFYQPYADVPGDVRMHEHQPRVPKYAPAPSDLPMYATHDLPPSRDLPMAARHRGGGASQEAYSYHGDFMHHHAMHHEMGGDHSPSSSTPTEETLNTRALTNEYDESDLMYSSSDDTSINTRSESQQEHHHPHMVGSFSQSGGHSQRHGYH